MYSFTDRKKTAKRRWDGGLALETESQEVETGNPVISKVCGIKLYIENVFWKQKGGEYWDKICGRLNGLLWNGRFKKGNWIYSPWNTFSRGQRAVYWKMPLHGTTWLTPLWDIRQVVPKPIHLYRGKISLLVWSPKKISITTIGASSPIDADWKNLPFLRGTRN